MRRFWLVVGLWIAALVAVGVLFVRDWIPAVAPSREECVALWNAPSNAVKRAGVKGIGYSAAEIGGDFSEDCYQPATSTAVPQTQSA
jgi:hypothetical protein